MTIEIAGFLTLLVIAIILFATERFSADVVALGAMVILMITGLLPVDVAFAGFGSPTVLMILGLLLLTEALMQTGVVESVGRWMSGQVGERVAVLRGVLLIVPGVMSSVISNTAAAAFFLPITLSLSARVGISASRLLLPLAFATILASSVTLIGTSTNLVVSGLLEQQGFAPLGMFELTPIGIPILVVGMLYLYTIGNRLLPHRPDQDAPSRFGDQLYLSEVVVREGAAGKTLDQTVIQWGFGVLRVYRDDQPIKPLAETVLQRGDILFVQGTREDIMQLQHRPNFSLRGVTSSLGEYTTQQTDHIAEVILLPGSPLIGRTIKGLRLRERYGLQILAMNQHGALTYSKIGRRSLRLGDVLMIQIPRDNLRILQSEKLFRVLDVMPTRPNQKAPLAAAIFAATLASAGLGILPIAAAVWAGVVAMFLTNCLTPESAYRNIEWKIVMLIGAMLAFGQAMSHTGTADFLATELVTLAGDASELTLMALFFGLTVALTQPISNQAAAALLVPIAISTATRLGYDPRSLSIMIAVAASCSFITPLEPACVIVYGAGRYRFMDFVRVGFPLTIIIFVVAMLLVPQML